MSRQLRIYNTNSRKVEPFEPQVAGEVGYYSCGPTVYGYAHLGNLRTYVFTDVLRRVLEYDGHGVTHVMNITDVGHMTTDEDEGEDKMEATARERGQTPWEIAEYYTGAFLADMDDLNLLRPSLMPKATEHIECMLGLIQRLEDNGYAYLTDSAVYFDTARFRSYGNMAGLNLRGQEAGARVEVDPDKRSPRDFALWKVNQPNHVMQWDSPWGRGYPGWHLECSAMSMKYLGETLDLHSGGIDHIPVHHTNEIAQSEGATGVPFVRTWVHANFLTLPSDGDQERRMGKSLGNVSTLAGLVEQRIHPLAYRVFCYGAKYRQPLTFDIKAIRGAGKTLQGLYGFVRYAPPEAEEGDEPWAAEIMERFEAGVHDDLNMPVAWAAVLELVREANRRGEPRVLNTLYEMDRILGLRLREVRAEELDIPADVKEQVARREAAREARDWGTADGIRDELKEAGWILEDTPQGIRVRPAE